MDLALIVDIKVSLGIADEWMTSLQTSRGIDIHSLGSFNEILLKSYPFQEIGRVQSYIPSFCGVTIRHYRV